MATVVLTPAAATIVVESLPLSIPLQAYAVNHDSAERAEPSPLMQQASGVKKRGVEGRPSRVVTESNESSPTTGTTLTHSSADDHEQVQGSQFELQ
jgi:hypothetical protein